MRFESKNAQIKRFVSRSFRNVPLSVSIHHQQWMCYQLLTSPGQVTSNFLYHGDHIVSGNECKLCNALVNVGLHIIRIRTYSQGSQEIIDEHVSEKMSIE